MAKLGNICKFQSGGTPAKGDSTYYGGKIPWITTVALNGGIIGNESAIEWITEKALRESAAKLVPAYSIMIGTRVGVGKVAINREEMSTSQDIISLIGINDTRWNKPYLCRFLQAKSDFLNAQARGATIKGIKIEVLSELDIPEITLVEQQRVADIFDKLSTLILKRQEQLRQMDLLVKSRFVEMFGDPENNPKHWNKASLSNVISNANNGMARRGNNAEGSIVLRLVELQDGFIDYSSPNRIVLTEAEKKRYLLKNRDFLFARVNGNPENVGRCAEFSDIGEPVYHNDHIIRVHFDENLINGRFASALLNNTYGKRQMAGQIKTSAGQYTINQEGIGAIVTVLPPLGLQNRFAAFVTEVDKSKFCIQKSLAASRKLWTVVQIDAIMNMDFSTQRSL